MKGQTRTVYVIQSKEARGWLDFDRDDHGHETLATAHRWLDYYIRSYDNGLFRIVKRMEEVITDDIPSRNLNETPARPTDEICPCTADPTRKVIDNA